jgi:hypothetical protein
MTDPVEILNARNQEVAQIRGFVDLTEEAKERRIAEVNERARAAYAEAIEANERERTERLEKSKREVFRIPIPYSATDAEAAQIRSSYRAARSDIEYAIAPSLGVDPAHTQGELERFLEQAELTQDPELARAAYHLAIKHVVQSVVDAYLSTRPQENKAWERYTTAQEEAGYASSIGGLLERGLTERALNTSPSSAGPGYPAAG